MKDKYIYLLMILAVLAIVGIAVYEANHPEPDKGPAPNTLLYGNERRDERAEPATGKGGIDAPQGKTPARMDGKEGVNP